MYTCNIFQALKFGDTVWSNQGAGLVVTWNGMHTFHIWQVEGACFTNIEMWTTDEDDLVFQSACESAADHMNLWLEDC